MSVSLPFSNHCVVVSINGRFTLGWGSNQMWSNFLNWKIEKLKNWKIEKLKNWKIEKLKKKKILLKWR